MQNSSEQQAANTEGSSHSSQQSVDPPYNSNNHSISSTNSPSIRVQPNEEEQDIAATRPVAVEETHRSNDAGLNSSDAIDTILDDAIVETSPTSASNTHRMCTRSKFGIHKPKVHYIGSTEKYAKDKEPETIVKALHNPEWKEAMRFEFKALIRR
ncbi:hypothetical protein SESBI_29499 [Sesbania bispinosa]|nr:hypothetical protein SESBI_29499 [Sesbania bispinosa]